ncbi:MAG: hypothetical protein D6715_00250 [Calditrichaeota bacterium]|nr:MAG: hypothetical protein D6715_00250 [Calditrichota bacterium]
MQALRAIVWLVILGLVIPTARAGEVTKVGTTAAPFLTISVGARALGMGGAFVGVANDASALFWNVAGIAQLHRPSIIFNHAEWLADINFDYAGLVAPLGGAGTLGASFTSLNTADMEQTTELNPEGTGVLFSVGSFAFSLSYARKLTDKFMIGFTGKFVRETIFNSHATGVALDVGTLFQTPMPGLKLGMSITNFGTKMHMSGDDLLIQVDPDPTISGNNETINALFQTDDFDMPLLFRVGISYELVKNETHQLLLAADALHPNDNDESMNLGGEYRFQDLISLRAGYRALFLQDSEEGFTVGAGLNTRLGSLSFRLDYAYEDFGRLNNVQKFTILLGF